MPLSELAINRPVGTLMVVVIIVFLGAVAFFNISADLLPEMEFPAVAVITEYPGAGPFEVETLISRPLEEAVATVGEVEQITSESHEGTSILVAEFDWGTDVDMAALDVREAIDHVRDFLPDDASAPVVIKTDPALLPVMRLSLSGPFNQVELTHMGEMVEGRLERIEGVASVDVEGGVREEIRVEVDPAYLNSYGLTHMHIAQALGKENLDLPAGHVTEADQRLALRAMGEFVSTDDIRSMTIPTPRGAHVALEDVASVRIVETEGETRTRVDGSPAVTLRVSEQSGADTVAVAAEIHRVLNEVKAELPGDLEITVVSDQSRFINRAIATVSSNVVLGGVLAVVILYLFLADLRTVFVIGLGIPISVLATFGFMYFSGITLNLVSMGGLALGVGMLVDNAIVILENIFRHREEGASPSEAAVRGTGEVAGAVTGSTLTTVAVFVPVVFIEGMAAQIFRQLAMTISFALASSLFVSLTFIPMTATIFLRRPPKTEGAVASRSARLQQILSQRYDGLVRGALARRALVLTAAFALFAVSVWAATGMPSVFLPDMDQREIDVEVDLPRGTALDRTDEVVRRIEDTLSKRDDVQYVFAFAGQSLGGFMFGEDSPDEGSLRVRLIDWERGLEETEEVIAEIRRQMQDVAGAEISVSLASGIAGSEQAMGEPVAVSVMGDDFDLLLQHSEEIEEVVRAVDGTTDVRSSYQEGAPEARLQIDRRTVGRYGLSASEVAMMIRGAVQGEVPTSYRGGLGEMDIRVIYPDHHTESISAVQDIMLLTPEGKRVAVSELVGVEMQPGPVSILRRDQVRQVQITADLHARSLDEVMSDVRAEVDEISLPPGYAIHYGGETAEMYEAFETLAYAFLAGCVLVFMVLATQFESLLHPIVVMATIPLALIGVVGGLGLWNLPLSVPAIVGVIGMAGIVVNNSIVMITYIDQLRARGHQFTEAIAKAAGIRLRPILMTSATTILGLLPMALETGAGAELQNAMAVSVLGGLVASTLLTLLVVPCLYSVLVRAESEVNTM